MGNQARCRALIKLKGGVCRSAETCGIPQLIVQERNTFSHSGTKSTSSVNSTHIKANLAVSSLSAVKSFVEKAELKGISLGYKYEKCQKYKNERKETICYKK